MRRSRQRAMEVQEVLTELELIESYVLHDPDSPYIKDMTKAEVGRMAHAAKSLYDQLSLILKQPV